MNINWQTILSVAGIILTIFFGILSYVFYRKGIKKKKLLITSNSTILISEDLSNYNGLQISYNNEKVKTLTSTYITLSNIGNDVIESSDITPSDPIIISTTNKFLSINGEEYKIVSSNKKVTTSLQKIDDSNLQLSFDFLNPKNELSITLLHNGDIFVNGDLKIGNVEKISYNDKYEPTISTNEYYDQDDVEDFNYSKFSNRILSLLAIFSVLMSMLFLIMQILSGKNTSDFFIHFCMLVTIFSLLFQRSK